MKKRDRGIYEGLSLLDEARISTTVFMVRANAELQTGSGHYRLVELWDTDRTVESMDHLTSCAPLSPEPLEAVLREIEGEFRGR